MISLSAYSKKEENMLSVQFSHSFVSNALWPQGLQHSRLPCPSPTHGVYSNSCPLTQWCHLAISSSVIPSPLAFNLSQHQGLFQWVSFLHQVAKLLRVSASASVLPMNMQNWFPLGRTGWISLQSKALQESFLIPQFKSINSSVLSFLYNPIFTSIYDY